MNTIKKISEGLSSIPSGTAWYLADIAESKGKQDLYKSQSPQKLKALREHALVESAVSSNRIEGVEIENRRIGTVVFGKPLLRDRNEEEVQGYRNALNMIHSDAMQIGFTESTVKKLHKMIRGNIWDAGKYKDKNSDIIERSSDGETRVRFKTVSASQTPAQMNGLVSGTRLALKDRVAHSLIITAAANLDFLCIHPFRDGNGRVSRLLLLLQLYHAGYEVGRFISIERIIEEHKERYYETLEMASHQWHTGRHDPWPYINFSLFVIRDAYAEFSARVKKMDVPKGGKTEIVISAVERFKKGFTLSELQAACPEVSREMIRKVLKDLRSAGRVESGGKGPGALWLNKGNIPK